METFVERTPARRFNPLDDFLFHKIMGEKGDEVQLLGFLNAVLGRSGDKQIASVTILENKTFTPETMGGKSSILDVRAELGDGSRVNIEVQLRNEGNMDKRSLFYWGKEFTECLKRGHHYHELPDVIAINIVNFEFLPAKNFHTCFHLREDTERDLILTSALEIHFLDMVKWRRQREKDIAGDALHRWMTWFNEKSPPELIEEVKKMDPSILTAEEKMAFVAGDEDVVDIYYRRLMWSCDQASMRHNAIEEGLAKGMAEGLAKGIDQGLSQGREQSTLEIARKMKNRGRPIEEVAEDTGLSLDIIMKL